MNDTDDHEGEDDGPEPTTPPPEPAEEVTAEEEGPPLPVGPSISPRAKLEYRSDRKYAKEVNEFLETNASVQQLIIHMKMNILMNKPSNILSFLTEDYFSTTRQIELTAHLQERDDIARRLQRGLDVNEW